MNNCDILSILHSVFLHCKVNNIDIALMNDSFTLHDTSEYKLGDLRIQENFIVWRYSFEGYTNDIKIIEIFEPYKNLEEFRIACFESLNFQKNMNYEIHEIFSAANINGIYNYI